MGLEKLEVENFKSYAGHHTIGPFDKFTCIIGPNGSGKSNIMDAIAFALGITSSSLRTSVASNLIHKKYTQASVKLYVEGHTLTRHITSGGRSTYFFDGKLVSFEVYTRDLESLNINLKLRNFMVFQGDIHEIANKNPKELCEYFEVLSGSIKYKKEYDEQQSLLNKELGECSILYEQKKNILAILKEEKEEEKQLESFKSALKEKSRLEKDILHLEVKEIKEKLRETTCNLEKLRESQGRALEEVLCLEKTVLKKKEEVDKLRNEYSTLEEEAQGLKLKKMNQVREMTNLYKTKDRNNIRKKEVSELIEENNKKMERVRESLEKERENLKRLEEGYLEMSKARESVVNGDDNGNQFNSNEHIKSNQLEEIYLKETEVLRKEIENLKKEIKKTETLLSKHQREEKIKKKEEEERRTRVEKLRKGVEVLSTNISLLYKKMGEEIKVYEALEKEEEEKNKRVYETVASLLKIRAKKKLNLKKETVRSVVHTLKNIFPGVHGILIDLVKPIQKKFYSPLLNILQSLDYAVVVDSDTTAMACINFIKEKKLCRLTFLPVKGVSGYTGAHHLYNEKEFRSALNCVSYEEKYSSVVHLVLRDTIITDTKEKALDLVYSQGMTANVCSLDNFYIQSKGRVISHLKQQEEKEEEFSRLVEERKRLLKEIKIIQEKKGRMSRIEIVKERIKVYEEKIKKDEEEIKKIEEVKKIDCVSNTQSLKDGLINLQSSMSLLLNNLKKKQIEIFGDALYEEANGFLEKSLEFHSLKKKVESRILCLEGEKEDLETQRVGLLRESVDITLKIKELSPEVESEIRKYEFLLEKKKGEMERVLEECEGIKEKYKGGVCKKREIDLRYLEMEINKNKLEEELEEKIRFNEIEGGEEYKEGSKEGIKEEDKEGMDIKEGIQNIPTLHSLRESLALINSKINEMVPSFKHNKKDLNYKEVLSQYEEAKRKAMSTRKKLNEIKRERVSSFMSCFEIVSQGIGRIYQEISRSEGGRGNAYLVLDNPSDPFLEGVRYHVMPPSKRFREIGYLSGGEKSMAILALMFSISLYKPVPFFVLDEFDSALDKENVGRMVDFFVRSNIQFLVISLKPILFQFSDSLVGVYEDPLEKSSKILTYRL